MVPTRPGPWPSWSRRDSISLLPGVAAGSARSRTTPTWSTRRSAPRAGTALGDFLEIPAPALLADALAEDARRPRFRASTRAPARRGGDGQGLARPPDGPVERQVAIKTLRTGPGAGSTAAGRLFAAEQRALARLNHPAIAQLHDARTTADGRPYVVMEYVDGLPITEYCDRERLPVEERLRIFVEVCRGVEHAHRRQLLHRDLKPSNVLVTETDGGPRPKIIDFGIARSIEPALGRAADEATGRRARDPGNPALHEPRGARADRRSARPRHPGGRLLARRDPALRAARRRAPFASADGCAAMLRRVSESDPQRPSDRVARGRTDGRAGTGGWAAGPSPTPGRGPRLDRPAGPGAGPGRSATGAPRSWRTTSSARCAPSRCSRGRRAVGRSGQARAPAPAGGGDGRRGGRGGAGRRDRDLDRAGAGLSRRAGRPGGGPGHAASARLPGRSLPRGLARRRPGARHSARRAGQRGVPSASGRRNSLPCQRARLLETLASVQLRLGDYESGRELAAGALRCGRRGCGGRPAEIGEPRPPRDDRKQGGRSRRGLRCTSSGWSRSKVAAEDPTGLADALNTLGNLRWRQGRLEEAEAEHRRALELREKPIKRQAPRGRRGRWAVEDLVGSLNNLGVLLWAQRRDAEAEPIPARPGGPGSAAGDRPTLRVATLANLGNVVTRQGRLEEGEQVLRQALALAEKVYGPDHPTVATALHNLGVTLSARGRPEEAGPPTAVRLPSGARPSARIIPTPCCR